MDTSWDPNPPPPTPPNYYNMLVCNSVVDATNPSNPIQPNASKSVPYTSCPKQWVDFRGVKDARSADFQPWTQPKPNGPWVDSNKATNAAAQTYYMDPKVKIPGQPPGQQTIKHFRIRAYWDLNELK
jgi:hypothetical protein